MYMGKRVLSVFLIIMLLFSLAGCAEKDSTNTELTDNDIQVSLNEKGFDVIPTLADTLGVSLDTGFKVVCREDQDISTIRSNVNISPREPYQIEKVSDKEFLINFENSLKPNSVYKVSLKDDNDKLLSWAFQTKKVFKLVSTLPADKATYVPVDSGIEMEFSYPNIKAIDEYFEIEPKVEGRFEYHKNTVVFVHDGLEPDTIYTVKLKPGIGLKDSDEVIKDGYTFKFKTKESENSSKKYFNFLDTLHNFTSKTVPNIEVSSSEIFKDKELEVEIYKYKKGEDFFKQIKELSDINFNWWDSVNEKIEIDKNKLEKVASFNTKLVGASEDSWGNFISFPEPLNEGYYLINVISGNDNYQTHIQINDIAAYIMLGEKESLAWVNDSKTGEPIAGAIVSAETGESAETNDEGIAIINEQIVDGENLNNVFFTIETNKGPTYYARVGKTYYGYNDFYYFDDYYGNTKQSSYWEYMYLDRGLYLPDDEVKVWGMVKPRNGKEMVKTATLHLYSDDYGSERFELDTQEVSINEFGAYEGSIAFTDLLQGRYAVELMIEDQLISRKYFEVRRYTKPSYKLTAKFDKDRIFGWESAHLDIQANFFEGSPVAGIKLDYSYNENDSSIRDKVVCDKNGYANIEYKPNIVTDSWYPKYINININNAEAEEEEIRASAGIEVFPRDVMIDLDTKYDEDMAIIEVKTNKIDINKEVDGIETYNYYDRYKGDKIDTDFTLNIYEISYIKEETGEYYDFINKKICKTYRYTKHQKLLKDINASTVDGYYSMEFPIEEGKNYEIVLLGHDTRNNNIVCRGNINKYNYRGWYPGTKYYYIEEEDKDKKSYKIGEEANIILKCNNQEVEEVEETDGDKMLYLILQDGLKNYTISENVKNSFEFKKEDIPNYYLRAVYFDGENIFLAGLKSINYDYTEKALDIDVKPDKESYRPGETVNLDVEVKGKEGLPVKAAINISVVDEAFFAVNEQSVDTLKSLYNYCYGTGIIHDYVSYKEINLYGTSMAEGGGGENGEYIRSDFKDTALFKSAVTNEYGKANISFNLPDNLTSWRVTYQGISNDLLAGSGKININAKLPFFVDVISSDIFMDGDSPCITVRSFGTELGQDDTVNYEVILTDEKGNENVFEKSSKGNNYTNIQLGKLNKGKYTVTIKARSKDYFDGVEKKFEVVDSMLKAMRTEYVDLNDRTKVEGGEGYTKLYFYNESSSLFYNTLMSLSHSWGNRVDQKLSRKLSRELMDKYFDEESWSEDYNLEQYQTGDGGIALLPYASSDPVLSAKITSVAGDLFNKYKLKEYFYGIIEDSESIPEHVAAAYWGLARLNEPVLIDIQRLLENTNLNINEKLILGIALADIGDLNNAEEIYVDILNNYGKKAGNYVYIDTGVDKDDILQATSLASILSLKLDKAEKYDLLKYAKYNSTEDILTYLEQLMFVMYDIPQTDQIGSFSYTLNGEEHEVKLTKDNRYELLLNSEEVKEIEFDNVKGDIVMAVNYLASVKDLIDKQDKNISLTRSYSLVEKSDQDTLNQSDLIKVIITPKFSESSPEGYYEITDVLPAGLRYVVGYRNDRNKSYPIERDGQRLVFGYHYNKKNPVKSIIYYARAVTPGIYKVDNAVMKHCNSNTMVFTEQDTITIEE